MKTLKAFFVSVVFIISLFLIPTNLFSQLVIDSVTTIDMDSNGHIDQLSIRFSETVDVTGSDSGLACFDITPITYNIDTNDYLGTVTLGDPLPVGLIEIGSYDTGEKPTITYKQGRANIISGGSGEIADDHSLQATDGAGPVISDLITMDMNVDGTIDRLEVTFSEGINDGSVTAGDFGIDGGGSVNSVPADGGVNDAVIWLDITWPSAGTDATPTLSVVAGNIEDLVPITPNTNPLTSRMATDGAGPVIVVAKTYDNNFDGFIDRVEFELSEPIVDVPGIDNFNIAGYVGESFSTAVTGINGGVDDNDADDERFSIGFTQGGGYDTGITPNFDYTQDGTDDVEDFSANKLASIVGGTTSDGANPVLVAAETTRLNVSGTNWWNRVNLTFSEPVWCGDLLPGSGLTASDGDDETGGGFDTGHGGDYSNGVLSGYGSFATGGNVVVPITEVGVTVEAGGIVRFDLARSDDAHGSISSGNTAPSGNFIPAANAGIQDASGNPVVSTAAVLATSATAWDLDSPSISWEATYDLNGNGHIDRVEFETSDVSSSGIQDGFTATNFDIATHDGEGFSTSVIGISDGVLDADANDNRFSITFTETGLWDTDAIPGYDYSGADIFLVDLAGNRLGDTGGTAEDGALPAFRSIVTDDFDENGCIDRITVQFSENVDITDAGGGGDGLDCIAVFGYTIQNGSYGAADVSTVTLLINEGGSYDTGVTPSTSYSTLGSSKILEAATPNEMLNGETENTADGAKPIMITAVFNDPDSNDIDVGDYIQIEFTEPVQLACTNSSDFELLNAAFGDSFGAGSSLDDPTPGDVYINIVLGATPSLILPDLWSVPGPGNPSGIGIKAGGTTCVEDLLAQKSPQGAEVDIGGAGSNLIVKVTATDGSSVFENPLLPAAFMDSDITISIETQFNANFVALWFDVGALPDGLSPANPNDRRVVATGSAMSWTATIPHDDAEMVEGAVVRFLVDTDGAIYYSDGPESSGGSVPWNFKVFYEQSQRVTIRNNVINPRTGDVTYINYYIDSGRKVTITAYDLAGNPVKVLFDGTGSAGTNLVTWNGRNRNGTTVVPGVYYMVIKIGSDRYVRKVLIVK
ncbi:MAG TPA: FlgD immunoglobulin-like domain containing protein [Spirochaetota bacterium]|nr:FlgD immunoglobulin-like domain containing protein [Spirochaetota bacterium]